MLKKKMEPFEDGVLDVYEVKGRQIVKARQIGIRFGNRTVGVTRFYQAKVADSQVARVVSVPYNRYVSQGDLIVISETQYTIEQIQEKVDKFPPCLYLSLKESVINYNRGGQENV